MKPLRWRSEAAIREGVLNAFFAGGRSVAMLLFAVLIGSGAVAFHTYQWQRLINNIAEAEVAGRDVVILSGPPGSLVEIDSESCEQLSQLSGVKASGVLITDRRTWIDQAGAALLVFTASPTLIHELSGSEAVVGASVKAADAGRLTGLADGPRNYTRAEARPAGIDINSGVVIPRSVQQTTAPACVVQLERFADARGLSVALTSSLSAAGTPVMVQQVAESYDIVGNYVERPERFTPLALGAIGALLGLTALRARGSELAAYRLSGTSVLDMYRIVLAEQSVYAGIQWTAAAATTGTLATWTGSDVATIAWAGAASLTWVAFFAIGSLPLVASDPTALAKDR